MQNKWGEVYEEVAYITQNSGPFDHLYRGHSNSTWKLIPSIARGKAKEDRNVENRMYFDFSTMSGGLLKEGASSWSIALSMQHHGLPTRLLDWSDNFSVALYFALRENTNTTPCIWILDPYALNKSMGWGELLPKIDELDGDYAKRFIDDDFTGERYKALAVAPSRHHARAFNQKSLFTVHDDLEVTLDQLAPQALTKIIIPKDAIPGAKKILSMAGVNEYSLFPDLDGLSREIKRIHLE